MVEPQSFIITLMSPVVRTKPQRSSQPSCLFCIIRLGSYLGMKGRRTFPNMALVLVHSWLSLSASRQPSVRTDNSRYRQCTRVSKRNSFNLQKNKKYIHTYFDVFSDRAS